MAKTSAPIAIPTIAPVLRVETVGAGVGVDTGMPTTKLEGVGAYVLLILDYFGRGVPVTTKIIYFRSKPSRDTTSRKNGSQLM